jgi:hypothetical protein
MRLLAGLLLALAPAFVPALYVQGTPLPPPPSYTLRTEQVGTLRVDIRTLPQYDAPMVPSHVILNITNTGTSRVWNNTLLTTVCGTTPVAGTKGSIAQQPPWLFLEPGESLFFVPQIPWVRLKPDATYCRSG